MGRGIMLATRGLRGEELDILCYFTHGICQVCASQAEPKYTGTQDDSQLSLELATMLGQFFQL